MCSGRWPGVWIASIVAPSPSSSVQPSAKLLVRILRLGQLVDVDRRPGRAGEAAVAGDVIGVVVGLQHVLDSHSVQARQLQVGVDVPLWVDHGGDAGGRVADQIGGAAEILVDYLAEEHLSGRFRIYGRTATVSKG